MASKSKKAKTRTGRTLTAGLVNPVCLELTTRVPEKWVAVDLETGQAFTGTREGRWNAASTRRRQEAIAAIVISDLLDHNDR
jgi:hypothetical protein